MGNLFNVTLRWAGPVGASDGSVYKIEENKNGSQEGFETLIEARAATWPFVSPLTTLAGNASYGATDLNVTNDEAFSAEGYGWIDDALIQWGGKAPNTLKGVIWHSGYGTYAAGTAIVEAHENYERVTDAEHGAVCFRVTHIVEDGVESAPLYMWFFAPPVPVSRDHCVVIVQIATDLGMEWTEQISVQCSLALDNQFSQIAGLHLNQLGSTSNANLQTTNAFGLAFFQCWKNSARSAVIDADSAYVFELDSDSPTKLIVEVDEIPDRDWVLLTQVASRTS